MSLSAAGSTDPDGEPLAYAWSFGDGTVGAGAAALKTYADDGTYVVSVVVTDPHGSTSTATTIVVVANASPSARLVAPKTVRAGDEFRVSLDGATDPSTADLSAGFSYRFDCGAGYGPWGAESSAVCALDAGTRLRVVRAAVRDKDLGTHQYAAFVRNAGLDRTAGLGRNGGLVGSAPAARAAPRQ